MEKPDGAQASGPTLAPCLAWALCLLRQWPEAPSSAGQPEPPPGIVTPADAPTPQDWPEPHPDQSPEHRCSRSLALEQLLGIIMEIAFPNLPVSEEKRISSLLGHQAPGYLPWEPVKDANPGPCLCVCLLSQDGCREADELRRRQCLRSPRSLWHFLAGSSTGSGLAEMRALLQDLCLGHCS